MNILPIKHISEIDQPLYGVSLYNLAQLERSGLPVLPGLALTPPDIVLNVFLRHLKDPKREVFEEKLVILKKELGLVSLPEALEKELVHHKKFFITGDRKVYKKKSEVWQRVLEIWIEEISRRIWNQGISQGVASLLSPQSIFFVHDEYSLVESYMDPVEKDTVIISGNKLPPSVLKRIDQIVISASKKLFLPQNYRLMILEGRVYICGLSPFTQVISPGSPPEVVLSKSQQKILQKSAMKIFLNLSLGLTLGENIDGIYLEGEKIEGFDQLVFRLIEGALTNPHHPVIFRLPDIVDKEKIRGALRLIHQQSVLRQNASTFLYARNKKNLLNLELAIPVTRSVEELLQIKRDLAALGITRKASLRLWQEMAVPENFVNLEDYLDAGVDGIILNLDQLQKNLIGYDFVEGEFYKKEIQTLIKFLFPSLKLLHKRRIPVLVKGDLLSHPDILDFLVDVGVWGVVVNNPVEAESLPEHLCWLERKAVEKRLLNT